MRVTKIQITQGPSTGHMFNVARTTGTAYVVYLPDALSRGQFKIDKRNARIVETA